MQTSNMCIVYSIKPRTYGTCITWVLLFTSPTTHVTRARDAFGELTDIPGPAEVRGLILYTVLCTVVQP